MATRTLQIVMAGDASSAVREFRKVEQASDRMGRSVDRDGKRMTGFASITSKGFSRVGVAATGMATVGAGAAAMLAKSFVSGASDINESLSKNRELFGRHAQMINRWSQSTAKNLGISRAEALQSAGAFGSLFETIGLADRPAAQMSRRFVQLASDLASFHNATPTEALEALRSGLVGESEPMRRFGALLSETRVKQEAWRTGIAKSGEELTEQQKVQARYQLILKDTSQAHGDAEKTGGMFAGQMRRLKAQLADTGAQMGAALIPIVLKAIRAINSLFDSSTKGGRAIQGMGRFASQAADWIKNAWADAVGTVRRFVNRNREDINSVVEAFQRMARHTRQTFDTIMDIIRPVLPFTKRIFEGMIQAARGLVRIITGLINGDWARVWDGAKDVVQGAFRAIKGVIGGAWTFLKGTVVALGRKIVDGLGDALGGLWRAVKDAIVSGVRKGVGAAGSVVGDIIGAINPFGDGIGKLAGKIGDGMGNIFPRFGGSLMGARPEMAPIAGLASRFGLGVTSGRRPGAITSSGNQSWHATGEALDVSGPPSAMMGFARFMSKRAGSLAELIYTPLGAWSHGNRYTPTGGLAADHYDHVHVAMDVGAPGQGDGKGRTGDGLGRFSSSSYGPPWNAMNGTGVTATGVNLRGGPKRYGVAVDPSVIPLGTKLKIQPNPFGYGGYFTAFDTGGAIKGKRIDFYDWRGRTAQFGWGRRPVTVWTKDEGPTRAERRRGRVTPGRQGGGPVGGGGPAPEPRFGPNAPLGYEGRAAQIDVFEAQARARNNLPMLVAALQADRANKRMRLKRVNRLLRGRRTREARKALLAEKAQLIADIKELGADITEFGKDMFGGAKTITQAEAWEGGVRPTPDVDTGGVGGAPEPTPVDTGAAELAAEIRQLRQSIDAQRKFATQVQNTENFQLKKYLADVLGSQVVGWGVVGRSFTPGSGVEHAY